MIKCKNCSGELFYITSACNGIEGDYWLYCNECQASITLLSNEELRINNMLKGD